MKEFFEKKDQKDPKNNNPLLKPIPSKKRRIIANELIQMLLIGKEIEIIDYFRSENAIKHKGIIVNETRNTFTLLKNNKNLIFPKYRVALIINDEKTKEEYFVEGFNYLGRPEERLKSNIRKLW